MQLKQAVWPSGEETAPVPDRTADFAWHPANRSEECFARFCHREGFEVAIHFLVFMLRPVLCARS